ncbi:MAG: hypothetical protein CMO55_26960 [Verrucomicrobiales bacterium]|nr:hypothetical protein [Verrucomicrobiales bacterium]
MKKISALTLALATLILTPAFADDTESLTVSEFEFKYGEPWIRQQVTSPMRAGQLTYDHEDEALADVDLVIYFFGAGQGGGAQANIDRWIGQFEGTPESKTEEKELGDKKVIFLEAKGTYMESMGGPFSGNKTAKPDYTMLAAILPSAQGDVFLKLTGPNDSVAAMKDAFMAFAESPFSE